MPAFAKYLFVALALIGGFFASNIFKEIQATPQLISLENYCLVTTNQCMKDNLSVSADKDVVHPLTPTQINAKWANTESESLIITLQGYEMEMGKVVFKLDKNQSGQFSGDVVLPVCTTDAMTWFGTITDGNKTMNISLRMER